MNNPAVSAALEALVQEGAIAICGHVLAEMEYGAEGELSALDKGRLCRVYTAAATVLTLNVIGPIADQLDKKGLADELDPAAFQPLEPELVDEEGLVWHRTEQRVDYLLATIPARQAVNQTLYPQDIERFEKVQAQIVRDRNAGNKVSPQAHAELETLYSFTNRWAPLHRNDPAARERIDQVFNLYASAADEEVRRLYSRTLALQTGHGTMQAKADAAAYLDEQIEAMREELEEQMDAARTLQKQIESLENRKDLLL